MESKSDNKINSCQRCGTCCTKGGPALHRDDRQLIEKGELALKDLYTIRIGEPVYDNVQKQMGKAPGEIIKIKGCRGTWTCCYYDDASQTCRIYTSRPLECRLLKCWDTGDLEAMYDKDRLERKDLIGEVEGLWDLVADHEQRCSYLKIADWVQKVEEQRDRQWATRIVEAINYDTEIRNLLTQKQGMDTELLEFLFGRPLADTFPGFGYEIKRTDEGIVFRKSGKQL